MGLIKEILKKKRSIHIYPSVYVHKYLYVPGPVREPMNVFESVPSNLSPTRLSVKRNRKFRYVKVPAKEETDLQRNKRLEKGKKKEQGSKSGKEDSEYLGRCHFEGIKVCSWGWTPPSDLLSEHYFEGKDPLGPDPRLHTIPIATSSSSENVNVPSISEKDRRTRTSKEDTTGVPLRVHQRKTTVTPLLQNGSLWERSPNQGWLVGPLRVLRAVT